MSLFHLGVDLGIEEGSEHGCGVAAAVFFGVHADPFEEALVEQAPALGACLVVDPVAVVRQHERVFEGLGDVFPADPSGRQGALDGGELAFELGLFGLELGDVEESFEVAVAQSLEGVLEGLAAATVFAGLAVEVGSLFFELVSDLVADVLDEVFGQPDPLVEQADLFFDVGHAEVALGARAVAAAGAEEVVVGGAALAGVAAETEAAFAAVAVEAAGEVVPVGAQLLAGLGSFVEDVADGLERLGVDERRVVARVLDAFEDDEAEVVAVAEHGGDLALGQRQAWALARRQGLEASVGEGFGEFGQCQVPGGEGLEGPADVFGGVGIDDVDPGFAPAVVSMMLRYPTGARPGVPPCLAFCNMPLVASVARLAEYHSLIVAMMPWTNFPDGVSSICSVHETNLAPYL